MERKESTPARESRRKYEEKHKADRKAQYKIWGTSVERQFADEIDEFLSRHPNLSKVAIVSEGYRVLKERFETEKKK